MQAGSAYTARSLDAPSTHDINDRESTLGQRLGCHDEGFARAENRAALRTLRHLLDDRERHILFLRFVEERTQTEIAEELGCSQMTISRTLRQTLERLAEAASPLATAGRGTSGAT
jgi:RNA polymerase sigma-B factor